MTRGWIARQIGTATVLGIVSISHPGLAQILPQLADGQKSSELAQVLPPRVAPANPTAPQTTKPQPQNSSTQRSQTPPNQFPPNPLEITEPDPLIPYDYKDRSLTSQERKEILDAANRLTLIGATRLQQGDQIGAFDAWNRELRLRRLLGPLSAEVGALGRVGDVAWTQNNTTQLRYITKRLDAIREQAEKPRSQVEGNGNTAPELLDVTRRSQLIEALGLAYQQVRLPKIAASLYQQVLGEARAQNNVNKIEATLITLGQLHLAWFDYDSAAKVYQELLERSRARRDAFNVPIYLNQLIYVYEQNKQLELAIAYQQQLIQFYQAINDPKPIPGLLVKIANHQRSLSQLDRAEANYQLAYKIAQPQSQFSDASNALKGLGDLYRTNDRLPAALKIYNFLIAVERQAYNAYGVMEAYDQLGQIHLSQKAYPEAIAAFTNGLAVARHLKTQEDYFTAQIQKASQEGE